MAVIPLLIKEKPLESSYTKHDQLYKELISNFFEEFRRMTLNPCLVFSYEDD